jgi:threonine aldolase
MVYVSLDDSILADAAAVASQLKKAGILVGAVGARQFRLVTHYWIDENAVKSTIRTFKDVLSECT